LSVFFFFQAEDGIRDPLVTGVQTCALPISFITVPPSICRRCARVSSTRSRPPTACSSRVCTSARWLLGRKHFRASSTGPIAAPEIGRASCRERRWIREVGRAARDREEEEER